MPRPGPASAIAWLRRDVGARLRMRRSTALLALLLLGSIVLALNFTPVDGLTQQRAKQILGQDTGATTASTTTTTRVVPRTTIVPSTTTTVPHVTTTAGSTTTSSSLPRQATTTTSIPGRTTTSVPGSTTTTEPLLGSGTGTTTTATTLP